MPITSGFVIILNRDLQQSLNINDPDIITDTKIIYLLSIIAIKPMATVAPKNAQKIHNDL